MKGNYNLCYMTQFSHNFDFWNHKKNSDLKIGPDPFSWKTWGPSFRVTLRRSIYTSRIRVFLAVQSANSASLSFHHGDRQEDGQFLLPFPAILCFFLPFSFRVLWFWQFSFLLPLTEEDSWEHQQQTRSRHEEWEIYLGIQNRPQDLEEL